ncbi:MAG TPA: glycosyltransferase family 2 protein [Blastocatellia bacterium]|nr:glycosyltransferase family 2 protein [Blastocatellia bacterium]
MARTLFWISAAAVFYTFIGYPVVVWLLARFAGRRVRKADLNAHVSVVIACHNEAGTIEARIKNLVEADYPPDLLEIIIVSDGSTDRTEKLARRLASPRVRVIAYPARRGKAAALNLGVANAKGDIILFGDARQTFEPDAIRRLVANFADERVGAVSGAYLLNKGANASVGESVGFYWKYEEWIRKNEGRLNSVVGAAGAIYAIRRELWRPVPEGTILDDVYTPMRIALGGHRIVFEERALARDIWTGTAGREFSRKVRTLTGNYQLCQLMPRLLLPTYGLFFQFFSHKLMRLAAPFFLMLLLVTNLIIGGEQVFYSLCLAGQVAFYAGVVTGGVLAKRNRKVRLLNVAYIFSVMNAAALVGLFYFIRGKRDVWAVNDKQI